MTPLDNLRFKKFRSRRDDILVHIEDLEAAYANLYEETLELLQETYPQASAISDYHDCENSPVGFCVYDEDEDPVRDMCLFCNQPEERK